MTALTLADVDVRDHYVIDLVDPLPTTPEAVAAIYAHPLHVELMAAAYDGGPWPTVLDLAVIIAIVAGWEDPYATVEWNLARYFAAIPCPSAHANHWIDALDGCAFCGAIL